MPTNIEILQDLKLENLPVVEQNKVLADIIETLQNRVAIRVNDMLSEDEKTEYDTLLAGTDTNASDQYLADHVPAMDEIIAEEYLALRQELMAKNDQILEALAEVTKENK